MKKKRGKDREGDSSKVCAQKLVRWSKFELPAGREACLEKFFKREKMEKKNTKKLLELRNHTN